VVSHLYLVLEKLTNMKGLLDALSSYLTVAHANYSVLECIAKLMGSLPSTSVQYRPIS
jgi:hypothetical protein